MRGYRQLFRKDRHIVFYCGGYLDYIIFRNVRKYLPDLTIVSKNRRVQKELSHYGIESKIYPSFPDVVIMARHVARKFPEKKILKFGMRHGPYHFKDFVSAGRYNAFDRYFVTSQKEVELSKTKGIVCAVSGGYPKLDPAFNGDITTDDLERLRNKIGVDGNKKTIIFTSTWDRSGTSAIEKWVYKLDELTDDYNVLVTVHHWMSEEYKKILDENKKIYYIHDKDIVPYLMISDIMVGDLSSIIAEFCALNKPLITFRVPDGKRTPQEIKDMLEKISYRIDTYEELIVAIEDGIKNPALHEKERLHFTNVMFDDLLGKSSERIGNIINESIRGMDSF